jgi:hypothetical protein
MKKSERIIERRMVEWEKAARFFCDGSHRRQLIPEFCTQIAVSEVRDQIAAIDLER